MQTCRVAAVVRQVMAGKVCPGGAGTVGVVWGKVVFGLVC